MLKAKRVSDNTPVVATEVARGPEYRCLDPACNQVVFIRKGTKRIHHFAPSAADLMCLWSWRNSCTPPSEIAASRSLSSARLQADERVVLSSESDRRADVLVWKVGGDRRVAIEVQHSSLSVADIERRTKAYIAADVPVIWIGLRSWGRLAGRGAITQ